MTAQEEQDWLAWRAQGITATGVAKALTGRYGGLWAAIAEKRGLDVDPDPDQEARMARGHDLEPVVISMVELGTGMYVVDRQRRCEHPDDPTWRCTPDGFLHHHPDGDAATSTMPVEIKTHDVNVRPPWDYYHAQCEWQGLVTGFDEVMLAVSAYDPALDLVQGPRMTVVRTNPLRRHALGQVAGMIAHHLEHDTWPDADGTQRCAELLAELHATPNPDSEPVDLTDLTDELAEWYRLQQATKREGPLDAIRNRVRQTLGDATEGIAPGFRVRWSLPANELDADRFLAAHPEFAKTTVDVRAAEKALGKRALDEYRERTGSRRLTIDPIDNTGETS